MRVLAHVPASRRRARTCPAGATRAGRRGRASSAMPAPRRRRPARRAVDGRRRHRRRAAHPARRRRAGGRGASDSRAARHEPARVDPAAQDEQPAWPSPQPDLRAARAPRGLAEIDPEIADLLGRELERQRNQIELIASENFTWPSMLEAIGSVPTNKYAEGYPGKRYYGGCEVVDEIETLAIDRAKELFGADHANVQPNAGAVTNMAVYLAVLQPGDTILSLELVARRPPHARAQGQLLGPLLRHRPLRRLARDEHGRLRRRPRGSRRSAARS